MIKLETENTKRQLSIHGWLGLIFGFLLYLIILTGAVVVFIDELSLWSAPAQSHDEPFSYSVDNAIEYLIKQVPPEYKHDVTVRESYNGYMYYVFTSDSNDNVLKRIKGVEFLVDPQTNKIIDYNSADSKDYLDTAATSLVRFIRTFHTDLYIPGSLSRYIVGLLGMMMLVATISGFLLHRHLIRDLFLSPRATSRMLKERDAHNLVGTWSLPFAFILSFTGAYLCFAINIGLPVMLVSVYEGNVKEAMSKLFHQPSIDDLSDSGLSSGTTNINTNNSKTINNSTSSSNTKTNSLENATNVDTIINQSVQFYNGAYPSSITIKGLNTSKSIVTTYHPSTNIDNNIFNRTLLFNGNTGQFVKELDLIGGEPSVSSRTYQLLYALHYGDFSGWLSRIVWFVLGIMSGYVVITGYSLWFEKRLNKPVWQKLYLSVPIITYGMPISFLTAGIGYFIAIALNLNEMTMIWLGFGSGWLVSVLALCALVFNRQAINNHINKAIKLNDGKTALKQDILKLNLMNDTLKGYLQLLLGSTSLTMPILRWLTTQNGWIALWDSALITIIVVDIFFILTSIWFIWSGLKFFSSTGVSQAKHNGNSKVGA